MVELQGDNFILRSWRKEDARSIYDNITHERILRNLQEVFPEPVTLEDIKKYIYERLVGEKQKTSFAIVVDNEAVGAIGFRIQKGDRRKTAHLGYWIGANFWNKGIMTKAVKLITDYAFKEFDLLRVQAMVYSDNPASARVLEKAGYELEGVLKKDLFKDGKVLNDLVYAKVV